MFKGKEMNDVSAVLEIFKALNGIPRPSHHEGEAAEWLCSFAERNGLEHSRDSNDCVVIRKPATEGYECHETVVILNHMDMVCVANQGVPFHPETSTIESYVQDGWMKAKGTSLGADNGIGLSMALAVLQSDDIPHPALEVLTTTNEEDGMSGASGLSPDFIKGRKVLNLDSEDYDTITVGAAGAYLQIHRIPFENIPVPDGFSFFSFIIEGGLGGHSGVDINKGRANANKLLFNFLNRVKNQMEIVVSSVSGGQANASIPSSASVVFGVPDNKRNDLLETASLFAVELHTNFSITDPGLHADVTEIFNNPEHVIDAKAADKLLSSIEKVPCGVIEPENCNSTVTPFTSNNIGVIKIEDGFISVSTHTRSFSVKAMEELGERIKEAFGSDSTLVMSAPAWREDRDSKYISMVSDVFEDILGFTPKKVEMHFVLEAGYYVEKYPGIQIASIGPRIVCPHSTKERVEMSTVENIWQVVKEVLKRL